MNVRPEMSFIALRDRVWREGIPFSVCELADFSPQKHRKILYKKCVEKGGIPWCRTRRDETPHAKLANAAREVCNFPLLRSLSLHAEIGKNPCSICHFSLRCLYFLCIFVQNASSQTPDFRGKRVLSPYFMSGVEKCRRRKNKPLKRVSPENILTNKPWAKQMGAWLSLWKAQASIQNMTLLHVTFAFLCGKTPSAKAFCELRELEPHKMIRQYFLNSITRTFDYV